MKISIFFDDHRDTETLNFVHDLLPYFKEKGYKTIAVEETSEKSQRDILKRYKKAYKKIQSGEKQDFNSMIKDNYLFIKNAIKQDFSIKAIDVDRKAFYDLHKEWKVQSNKMTEKLYEYSDKKSFLSQEELLKEDYIIDLWVKNSKSDFVIKRDENFVKQIDKICQKTDAGIIAIIGSIHARVVDGLKDLNYNEINAFMTHENQENQDFDSLMYQHNPEVVKEELFSSVNVIEADSIAEGSAYVRGVIEMNSYHDEF